jgi:hypothetical protein
MQVIEINPFDATMFSNRSLCWLRMREGERALSDAQRCRQLMPGWCKGWYLEGTALNFMEVWLQYKIVSFSENLNKNVVCIYWCRGWGFTPISEKKSENLIQSLHQYHPPVLFSQCTGLPRSSWCIYGSTETWPWERWDQESFGVITLLLVS